MALVIIKKFFRFDLSMELEKTFVPPIQQVHNIFLMEHAMSLEFKDCDLHYIQACRLFLGGVSLLSDIVTADGKEIRPEFVSVLEKRPNIHKG